MDFSEITFRCSSLSNLMTEPKLKVDKDAGNLSQTTKNYLMERYIKEKFKREKNFSSKYTEKGLLIEEENIDLYNRVRNTFLVKNELTYENIFITGTPDLLMASRFGFDMVIDIKSSWDIFTFYASEVTTAYYWQLQGYMALTGAKSARLAYCLGNTPQHLIDDEKRKLLYKMNCVSTEDEDYKMACMEIDMAMTFDDIPDVMKVIEYLVERDEVAIEKIYDNVKKARLYLAELHNKLNK